LVGLAADEAVEVIEALETWPAIERTGEAGLPVRDLMFLPT
jgi:hypothetical protein